MTRRRRWVRLLAFLGAASFVLVGVIGVVFMSMYRGARTSTVDEVDFRNGLRIPDLYEGERDDDGVVHFDLRAQAGETTFERGDPATVTWGVNGTYLGPTLRMQRGDTVAVEVRNDLPEATTMHWHGMHLPGEMDGGPHQPVAPGTTWSPTWDVDQPAATLWYHPHPHGETAEHVQRGVAGMIIVEDPTAETELPDDYGVDDVPVIIQDRSFDDDRQFDTSMRFGSNVGGLGDEILVNGTPAPFLDVTTERVRLRLLNASNARFYDLGFPDGRPLTLIGTDGGLSEAPVEVDRVLLSPGERAEVIVELPPGQRAVLRSFSGLRGSGFPNDRLDGHEDSFDVLELRAADELATTPQVPTELETIEPLDPGEAVARRTFQLSGTQINGENMDMDRIDEVVAAGTIEVWDVVNGDGTAHNFHVHGVQFQVLDLNGEPPPPVLDGWKDTIPLGSDDEAAVIMRFTERAGPDAPYMFHCHILRHEDNGMMGQFVVADPNTDVDASNDHIHD